MGRVGEVKGVEVLVECMQGQDFLVRLQVPVVFYRSIGVAERCCNECAPARRASTSITRQDALSFY